MNDRDCRHAYPGRCKCTHTECRNGWLDSDSVIVRSHGRAAKDATVYPAARRCPVCALAIPAKVDR